jgi:hypothetical protein
MNKIDEIESRFNAATPGPWKWLVNKGCKDIKLVTVNWGNYYVMGFERWGFEQAQPTFQKYENYKGSVQERKSKGMRKAIELSKWNQTYRSDDGWIDHPDAEFIAHSQDDIVYLLSELERVTAERDATIAELSVLKEADRWIPMSERLPEYMHKEEETGLWSDEVEFFDGKDIYIGYLSEKYSSWMNKEETIDFSLDDVTHWRPLPELPESEE